MREISRHDNNLEQSALTILAHGQPFDLESLAEKSPRLYTMCQALRRRAELEAQTPSTIVVTLSMPFRPGNERLMKGLCDTIENDLLVKTRHLGYTGLNVTIGKIGYLYDARTPPPMTTSEPCGDA